MNAGRQHDRLLTLLTIYFSRLDYMHSFVHLAHLTTIHINPDDPFAEIALKTLLGLQYCSGSRLAASLNAEERKCLGSR
jgi:hypothetical protein